ncbi:MAG TPA: NAD(P)/FAD-dependent oxidoreductase [Actinomycetota bacterium]|nr:NAD(P)/FAD-dependent oxidoreductase [Actinomycetota bacterium]
MLSQRADALVIGGGQAGLATGHELGRVGVEHVILERDRVGSMWRGLWDGFHINTPNWSLMLPGHAYDGDDPDGFMTREGIVGYLDRYAQVLDSPVREGVGVTELRPTEDGFRLETTDGPIVARTVVVCTGAFQRAFRPPGADGLPAGLLAIDTRDYRDPSSLPEGAVLVVGNGQSGCQIAEELVDAGREVVLSCGRAAWAPRSVGGHDLVWWALETGFLDQSIDALPSPAARLAANVTASGVAGGHDLHARSLRAKGVRLVGRFAGCVGSKIRFEGDLIASVAWSDERYMDVRRMIEKLCAARGIEDPGLPDPEPFEGAAPDAIATASLGAAIFASGFRSDYADWIDLPMGFDEMGFPVQRDGASSVAPGLFFAGVHFLRKRKSSLLCGVGEDAAIVADGVAEHLG